MPIQFDTVNRGRSTTTMATSKSSSSGDGSSRLFKTFDVALRKSERHLLLSTTYGLNNSWTKKVTVGLRLRLDGTFAPVVRLINNFSTGVSLTVDGWRALVSKCGEIDRYFDGEGGILSQLMMDTVPLDTCTLRFTSSHSSKSIAVYKADGVVDEGSAAEECDEDENEPGAGPAAKKTKKDWVPIILMQKPTFEGLKHLTCCVEEHLERLENVMGDVNACKDLLVRYFATVLKNRKIKTPTLQQISVVVYEEGEGARRSVSTRMEEGFREHYHDIVFYEITRLFLAYIVADIRQCVLTESV